jgi:hypothetical protein
MKKVYILIENVEGINENVMIFESAYKAHEKYEEIIKSKGFRAWKDDESFSDYQNAFFDWEYSEECDYDPGDWHLKYLRKVEVQ